jgi:hypothetical protein
VLDVQDDGTTTERVTYDRATMDTSIGLAGEKMHYDSLNSPRSVPPAAIGAAAVAGQNITMKMSPLGKVLGIEGFEKIIEREFTATAMPEEMKAQLRAETEKNLSTQSMQAMGLSIFPAQAVSIGDSWTQETAAVQAAAPVLMSNTYTLLSRAAGQSLLGVSSEIRPNVNADSIRVSGTSIKYYLAGNQTGTTRVDEATGVTTCFQLQQRVTGPIMITVPHASAPQVSRIYISSSVRGWMISRS